jgi:hypothetical protein
VIGALISDRFVLKVAIIVVIYLNDLIVRGSLYVDTYERRGIPLRNNVTGPTWTSSHERFGKGVMGGLLCKLGSLVSDELCSD